MENGMLKTKSSNRLDDKKSERLKSILLGPLVLVF